jgi:hypothetical protein
MRWAAKRNWSWPVTLPKAVEFRSAMEQLGIADPTDRIAFVRKHKLPVFIALSPLIGKQERRIRHVQQTPLEKERIRQLARIVANLNQLARWAICTKAGPKLWT